MQNVTGYRYESGIIFAKIIVSLMRCFTKIVKFMCQNENYFNFVGGNNLRRLTIP